MYTLFGVLRTLNYLKTAATESILSRTRSTVHCLVGYFDQQNAEPFDHSNSGQKLETVTSFKYLGSVITDEGFKPEILSRTAQTTMDPQSRTSKRNTSHGNEC